MNRKYTISKTITAYSKNGNPVGEAVVEMTFFGYGQPMMKVVKYTPNKKN